MSDRTTARSTERPPRLSQGWPQGQTWDAPQGGFFLSNPKPKYTKPPLSLEDQVKLLVSRGMTIPDHERAKHYLKFIGYYRLSGYVIQSRARSRKGRHPCAGSPARAANEDHRPCLGRHPSLSNRKKIEGTAASGPQRLHGPTSGRLRNR